MKVLEKIICLSLLLCLLLSLCSCKQCSDGIEYCDNDTIIYEGNHYVLRNDFPFFVVEHIKIGWIRNMYNFRADVYACIFLFSSFINLFIS